ncbi:retinoic acid-induced protein 1 [Rana temporaria]|uniref:retinoic acid-induced protein 1 n=1 Tax=Rana temporaria TaxID=8407 RepID=UPI001AAC641E|nr:retinoic acid-induced protein 1 [Rana temporaria]XP_040212278.1 retinoic acid-induced protein 1 [Rana temporaria]
MQSFRERCGFHGNQQNYQPSSQDSSRLENYRHQSQPGLNCVRQRQMTKGYYAQTSYQGYENNSGEKYPRGDKHINVQQLQGRVSFASFPEANVYPAQYSGEDGLQNWGQTQALTGAKYEENVIKKTPGEERTYQDPSGQMAFRSHSLHHPQQQPSLNYPKLPRQKVQNDVPSSPHPFSQSPHYNPNFPTSTYSSVPPGSPVSHSFKSCTAPSNPPHERAMAAAAGQRVQAMHGYQASRMASYEQSQRHHTQESLHYQNMAKYQHYSQQGQAYCQPETPSRTPEQYYQPFSPSASHSPARSVGRSPSYSSTPSPLMTNLENFQYNQQQQHNPNTFPMGISEHSHYMPLLNPSPTGTSSPESQTKSLQNDKIPETLLSDLSLQSLTALTSQVENISSTVQQLLLSKSGIPQKKGIKTSPRTPESMKTQHCSSESSAYSSEPMGTPLSETLGTPQSVHAEMQDTDYLSGSEDHLERNYMYCGPGRSPGRANSTKMKPESISTCSVTSPDNMSTKSDDSFQSIHTSLPLETFAKLVSSERECPHLLVNALSQEELSTEIIALQDAIDNEKAEKAWADSPELNSTPKSPFNLENHRCVESVVKNTWSNQGASQVIPDAMKKVTPDKTQMKNSEFCEIPTVQTKLVDATEKSVSLTEKNIENATSSSSYAIYSNTLANTTPKSSDPFEWPDKNMSESCLRWKEIELTLNSDLQKGLFQNKENKVDSQLDVPDVETPLENDSGEEFNKEGAEELTYTEDGKTDEKWLEDTRDCYAEDEFQDIPDLPSQKESNLEPEDYSSLCDFSERKSLIDDESLPKQVRDTEAFSSINTPESIENPSTEEKENVVECAQLSDSSIMLLGPTVETESKVNSWFESTLPHIKAVEDTKENTEESKETVKDCSVSQSEVIEAEKEVVSTLPEESETVDQQATNEQTAILAEEPPVKKPQRGRRCKAAEAKVVEISAQITSESSDKGGNQAELMQTQNLNATTAIQVDKAPVTQPKSARMCTRSSTAKVEPQECGTGVNLKAPHPEKLSKRGAFGEKEKVPYKTGKKGGKNGEKIMSTPSPTDQETIALQNKQPSVLSAGPKSKKISILKDEKSMILRSRNKKQELFPAKRRRGKRGMNFVLKKRTSLKKIITNNCVAADTFPIMPKIRKRMKLSTSGIGINVKTSEKPLHSLKRKSTFISPVPAKKKNLIIRSKKTKEQKSENPPNLFKKIKPVKKEKVKLKLATKKACKVILNSPSIRMAPEVCLKMTSRSSYLGAIKTKVLPPRKGRGLKMEAIVQKITSPNQKKQGAPIGETVLNGAVSNNTLVVPSQGKELRDNSLVIDAEAKLLTQDIAQIESPKPEAEMHTVSCRGGNRSFKGKPYHKKKGTSNSLHGEIDTQPVVKLEGRCRSSKKLNTVPKTKLRRGRSKSSQRTSKTAVKTLLAASPSVLLTSKDKSLSENSLLANKYRPNVCKKLEEGSVITEAAEETSPRARKKTKHPTFNGYNKRQRKCSSQNNSKSTSQPPGSKRRGKRHNIPPVTPKEPEIKLKYVSAKPVRAENRVRLFTPYIQVEQKNTFTTICTVINTSGEEARLLKERSAAHSASQSVAFASQGSLPFSSRMQLGPLVCKSVSSGCLLCCLCRCPANYKDLGDLCGPYYPMDCLPNKKSRLKDKPKPEDTDKSSKAVVSLCTVGDGRPSCTDGGATDVVKPNALRSSARGMLRKLPSCYCCSKKLEVTETEKPKRHQCVKVPEVHSAEPETQEHWVHEACAVWTSGVYLVAGKLYGIHEAIQMAASVLCPKCQKSGATVGCSHKGCVQSYHYTCAMEAGCLLSEENFSLRCPKHKRHLV